MLQRTVQKRCNTFKRPWILEKKEMASVKQLETSLWHLFMDGFEIGDRGDAIIAPAANEYGHLKVRQPVVDVMAYACLQLVARSDLPTGFVSPDHEAFHILIH